MMCDVSGRGSQGRRYPVALNGVSSRTFFLEWRKWKFRRRCPSLVFPPAVGMGLSPRTLCGSGIRRDLQISWSNRSLD